MPGERQASGRGRPRQFDRTDALHRALELFWERGYEGTSVSDLTEALGITAPSLYAAFGSKEALFRETIEFYNDPARSPTALALHGDHTVRDAIERLLRDNAAAYCSPGTPSGCFVVLGATNVSPANDRLRVLLTELREQDRRMIRARLDDAVSTGELAPSTDTAALARFVSTVLHGLSIQARDGATETELESAIDVALVAWDTLAGVSPTGRRG